MERKIFSIDCENVILVIRPNGETVIVTDNNEVVIDKPVMEQVVRSSAAYKSFVATKDEVVAGLERDNVKLQNEIVGLKEELEQTKAAKDSVINGLECDNMNLQNKITALEEEFEVAKADKYKLQKELNDVANGAQSMVKGYVANVKACRLYDIDGSFLVDCGTSSRANRVQELLQEGKISLDMVMMVFGDNGGKKKKAVSKAEVDDFDWGNVPVENVD